MTFKLIWLLFLFFFFFEIEMKQHNFKCVAGDYWIASLPKLWKLIRLLYLNYISFSVTEFWETISWCRGSLIWFSFIFKTACGPEVKIKSIKFEIMIIHVQGQINHGSSIILWSLFMTTYLTLMGIVKLLRRSAF